MQAACCRHTNSRGFGPIRAIAPRRKKYYARLSLLPLVAVPGKDDFGENLLKPYFAPPDVDNWPGRPAAPYYDDKSAQKRVDKNKVRMWCIPPSSHATPFVVCGRVRTDTTAVGLAGATLSTIVVFQKKQIQ